MSEINNYIRQRREHITFYTTTQVCGAGKVCLDGRQQSAVSACPARSREWRQPVHVTCDRSQVSLLCMPSNFLCTAP
jgi:hypothetical protein